MPEIAFRQLFERDWNTVILAPHPDDETVGCALLIQRLMGRGQRVYVGFLTNGIASEDEIWRDLCEPYGTYAKYCAARKAEKEAVIRTLGFSVLCSRGHASRSLLSAMREVYAMLLRLLRQMMPVVILSPSYEGGHPDHDLTNCIAYRLSRELNISCFEYALYHRLHGKERYQTFLPVPRTHVAEITGTAVECKAKAQCLQMYRSQYIHILSRFSPDREAFRELPRYDYGAPPTREATYYETWQCGVSSQHVSEICREFLHA